MPNMRGRGGGKKRGTFPKRGGGGRGRGVSHNNFTRAGVGCVVGRFSHNQNHDDDDVVLVDEEGNDQAQQNPDLRSVLNERR